MFKYHKPIKTNVHMVNYVVNRHNSVLFIVYIHLVQKEAMSQWPLENIWGKKNR